MTLYGCHNVSSFGAVGRSSQSSLPRQSVCRFGNPDMGPDHSGQKPKPAIADDNANAANLKFFTHRDRCSKVTCAHSELHGDHQRTNEGNERLQRQRAEC